MANRSVNDDASQAYMYYTKTPISAPSGTLDIIANATGINVSQYAYANVQVDPNVGTKGIMDNGTYNASSDSLDGYSSVTVNVPPEYDFRDKTIIPDKYNTGCRGYLTPFDLSSDTSGLHYNTPGSNLELKFNTQYSSVIRDVDPSHPIIYKNIDFTAYPQFQFMQCGDCHKEDANYTAGVVIIFENCLFRKVYTNGSFTSADMIQFAFINCTMEYFNISNSIVYGCKIGNKTFYKNKYGDEVLEDAIGVNSFSTIANSYVMDVEPKVSTAGGAHFDGLQANTEHDYYTLYNVRFECMNMPYDPKGGAWTQAVNFEHAATHLYMAYCIIHGGGYYQCSIRKGENQTVINNYIERSYSTPCYPSDQTYQLSDGFAELYSNLYVSSCFADNTDITVVCTNDTTTAKTLTVIGYNTAQNTSTTYTFNIPACPARDSGWTGIDEWDDLPFDVSCKLENAYISGIDKIECYDGTTKLRTWYVSKGVSIPDIDAVSTITSNGTYDMTDKSKAIINVPSSVSGTVEITSNGTGIDVAQYAYADVAVSPNVGTKSITTNGTYNASSDSLDGYSQVTVNVPGSELINFDKNVIPDKYNTGAHGYLTPFDLAGDTSGLLWQTNSTSLYLDFNTNSKQTIYNVDTSSPIFYKNIDFTAYPEFNIANANLCSKTDQYWKSGVQIVFENCIFRKVNSAYEFSSADMIQFVFINCSMYNLKISNAYAERCLIGNRTFYKDAFGDEDILDGIKLWSYDNLFSCYIMDLEPKVTSEGSAHFDGLQFTNNISQSSVVSCRFECMNMPYNPKGGGWSYSIYYQGVCTNGYLINNIFHGGGNYETAVTKLQGEYSVVSGNLVEGTYSTPCYPNANYYQMTDDWATTYDTLLVSSVFFDGVNLYVVCSNDIGTSKTLTVKLYTMLNDTTPARTETFSINACPTFSGSWTGIDEWDDLPFDKIYTVENVYQVNKVECYDGSTKLRTWYISESAPVPEGVKTITANGTYDVSRKAAVTVNVPSSVSGTIEITQNGTGIDVGQYQYADVIVPSGGLPSDMQIVNVSITEDVTGITISYDNTRQVAMLFVIPDILQGVAYEITFMMAKMNFYTGASALDQVYGTLFNYNYSGEQPYQNTNMGSVTVDSTNATITINGKGSNYKFKNGDTFRVLIVYGGID